MRIGNLIIFNKTIVSLSILTFLATFANGSTDKGDAMEILDYDIQLDAIHSGYDGKTCWVHARAGAIPGEPPIVVLLMQKLLLSGSDVFYALNEMRTDDFGLNWSGPIEHDSLARREKADGIEVVFSGITPQWHVKTGKLLGIGLTVHYADNRLMPDPRPERIAYSVYDTEARLWTSWDVVEMPDEEKFYFAVACCVQRYDLPDGDILLPISFMKRAEKRFHTLTVTRCSFDGEKLSYMEHGDEFTTDIGRGFYEPSLTRYRGRYFLTIRNDEAGYVTSGSDGLHFDTPIKWTFDDGKELGSYNTQQHWVAHRDGLFLVYTRRGANNDHVFRHRAPLFIAQVDPDKLCVIRETERILVPERGARLGNFGVTDVNEKETWVTVTEWMQPLGCEKYGSDNSVYVARVIWR